MHLDHFFSLLALYNVNLDVYGSREFGYVIDEQTKDLQENSQLHRT